MGYVKVRWVLLWYLWLYALGSQRQSMAGMKDAKVNCRDQSICFMLFI